eukprot:CAMPEP_0185027174 /NCGR_PEP_ID=MMETSP1103-20130426/11954_1 /TAXON_ID=36769 /ORGANISM="Paraphysomonas bandaiensis, Strain Caron Lab Isolate" /LENGTH=203 /DNA_ID=CAMNT_0027561051 /DNA_START=95 /DNA_END=706 /DNA_ORIENTATION=+
MDSKRECGLDNALDSKNRGFKLLQKFGYESGGLGKDGGGIEEPLRVEKREKTDRNGLGREVARVHRRMQEQRESYEASLADLQAGFIASQRHKQQCKEMLSDIRRCENVIYELDCRQGIKSHNLWPEVERENLETELTEPVEDHSRQACALDNADEFMAALSRLELCITYLRSTYKYCIYCGCDFDTWEDMDNSCPGPLRNDH